MKNKKNIENIIIIIVFIGLLIFPVISSILLGKSYQKSTQENRVLKEKPKLSLKNVFAYPKEFEAYFNDNLPYKYYLVKINNLINYALDVSFSSGVIKGEDGWLFLENTIGDYLGENIDNNAILEKVKILKEHKNYLDEKKIKMYVMFAPNKNIIYPEYMPSKYRKFKNKQNSQVENLVEYLSENTDIQAIYLKKNLLEYKGKFSLYFKLDTHWNSLGAYIGYSELMKLIDPSVYIPPINELQYSKELIKFGDLANMINLNGYLTDEDYYLNYNNNIEDKLIEESEDGTYIKYTSSNKNHKKVLVFRDSFFIRIMPYFNKQFEEVVYTTYDFSEDIIEKENPDIVVFESVERNLKVY